MLLAVALAWATDPSVAWKALYEARFVQVAEGTPENAVRLMQALIEDAPKGESVPLAAHYWLGRAQLSAGDLPAALASLQLAVADSAVRREALALIDEAELRRHAVASIPARFAFESEDFPGVRSGA